MIHTRMYEIWFHEPLLNDPLHDGLSCELIEAIDPQEAESIFRADLADRDVTIVDVIDITGDPEEYD